MGKIIVISKMDEKAIEFTKSIVDEGKNSIIFLSDAVLLLENKTILDILYSDISDNLQLYALKEDVENRSIKLPSLNVIDYEKLVDILMESDNSIINL